MKIEEKLNANGVTVPQCAEPKAMYIPVKKCGNLLFVSGQIPVDQDGNLVCKGKLGDTVSLEDGKNAARLCALNILGAVKYAVGDLDKVKSVVKITVFVSSKDGYTDQHLVANGASELLFEAFGDLGKHTRSAVSVNNLPLDASVEVEAIVEVE